MVILQGTLTGLYGQSVAGRAVWLRLSLLLLDIIFRRRTHRDGNYTLSGVGRSSFMFQTNKIRNEAAPTPGILDMTVILVLRAEIGRIADKCCSTLIMTNVG